MPDAPVPVWTREQWDTVFKLAQQLGFDLPEGTACPTAPSPGTTFADFESACRDIGLKFARELNVQILHQHANSLSPQFPCPKCARSCEVQFQSRSLLTVNGSIDYQEPYIHCSSCRDRFFFQRLEFGLDQREVSPLVLAKMVHAGVLSKSYEQGRTLMWRLADIKLGDRYIDRVVDDVGHEYQQQQDQEVSAWKNGQRVSQVANPPKTICVEVDGGRIQTREPGHGPGVTNDTWKETKAAGLFRLESRNFKADPHPELPLAFRDQTRVEKITKEVHNKQPRGIDTATDTQAENSATPTSTPTQIDGPDAADLQPEDESNSYSISPEFFKAAQAIDLMSKAEAETNTAEVLASVVAPEAKPSPESQTEVVEQTPTAPEGGSGSNEAGEPSVVKAKAKDWQPKRLVRSCLSSMVNSDQFGAMMGAEATRRGFDQASEGGFVGDGMPWNWSIHRKHFPHLTAILDFIHAMGYLYAMAVAMVMMLSKAAQTKAEVYKLYLRMATACWQGRVIEVIEEARKWLETNGWKEGMKLDNNDPRAAVLRGLRYLEKNQSRMDYPKYRKMGLPTTSSWIESEIKELNWRVKGTEKFWNNPEGAEIILRLRAAELSEDDRMEKFLKNRKGSGTYRKNPVKNRKAA